jgi:hypothetical protein
MLIGWLFIFSCEQYFSNPVAIKLFTQSESRHVRVNNLDTSITGVDQGDEFHPHRDAAARFVDWLRIADNRDSQLEMEYVGLIWRCLVPIVLVPYSDLLLKVGGLGTRWTRDRGRHVMCMSRNGE